MPHLSKIVIRDFRNIALQELDFSPNINCISGGNGEGKTNLLEAIWYLSMTRSASGAPDSFSLRYGAGSFEISGRYLMGNGTTSTYSISVSEGEKKLRKDGRSSMKLSDHIGTIPIVMVSPSDVNMVSESGEHRRRFVNMVLSQTSREYLGNLTQYNRLLASRNSLLKNPDVDDTLLETFDERMTSLSGKISSFRGQLAETLTPIVKRYYEQISGGCEQVDISYSSSPFEPGSQKDRVLRFTSTGPQRDDFSFIMNGYPIRRCGSQGQQKSFLVALKFAQYEVMRSACGAAPILLLDDLFDKLDMSRVENLLGMVSGSGFGQIFLSDSNKVRIKGIVDSLTEERAYFEAAGGAFSRKDE